MKQNRHGTACKIEGGLRTKGYFKKSYENHPLISVITVVFNGGNELEKTILSVINQTYDNLEYIIIDGGSTDRTLDIIKKYEDNIDYWMSEKDAGIYHAMNKGLSVVQGRWINFMNAGDIFFTLNIVAQLQSYFTNNDVVFGNVSYISKKIFNSKISSFIYCKNIIHHQGAFYAIKCFQILGCFDTKYNILADYDFNLKLYVSQSFKFKKVDETVALCSDLGVSDIPKSKNYFEEIAIRNTYLKSNILKFILYFYTLLRFFIKRLNRSVIG